MVTTVIIDGVTYENVEYTVQMEFIKHKTTCGDLCQLGLMACAGKNRKSPPCEAGHFLVRLVDKRNILGLQ